MGCGVSESRINALLQGRIKNSEIACEQARRGLVGVFLFGEGEEHDVDVEHGGPVFDVVEVVFDAVYQAGVATESVHLGPAGDAGADFVAGVVMGDLVFELGDEFGAFGAGAYQAHVADEDVPELGKFVEVPGAHEGADFETARIGFDGPLGTRLLGVETHGAEFVDGEGFAVATRADLAVEDGTGALAFDDDRKGEHDGAGEE
jgi:hypothetical protein